MYYNTEVRTSKILSTANKHITSEQLYSFNIEDQQNLLLETFMRSWKSFWMEYNSIHNPFKKELILMVKNGNFVFKMFLKNHKENEPAKAKVFLKFFFRSNSSFEVTTDVFATEEALRQKYLQAANKILDDVRVTFSLHYDESMFLRDWFDTLHAHRMSQLTGKEAQWIYKIHNNAVKHFPAYHKMSTQKQIDLLQAGALKALPLDRKHRDIHSFAKLCFEEIKAANAANSFIAPNPITHQPTLFQKIVSRNKGVVSLGDYMYGAAGLKFRTTMHDFDVWDMLCTNSMVQLAEM